ncbi:HAD family phosphatase [Carbonactinospora thermoautotrophica]|uniref:Hydrolase n=1 Tax=Carbonactinospora thermoautotrophica TaxID=1469144 RepID=A0A132NF06_9ACTN|nr:HAD family phosphatase [Carbonactinospora thermoautotrophica]KWX01314.1 HAD-superfamily hydrolase [Carbonactinospora thermoautotrophica]KWX05725.1 hydrolase [Carbonactinospora thermoautotrophica]KWX08680.1 hydrolase [Carbonactinospora thermoautotrophica]MCX9192115.1 HAD family phosphatase [Carbonactinospora thermoautotrophica]
MPSSSGGLQAVFFDMDGLLVDTEPTWHEVEAEVMAEYGYAWTPEDRLACLGGPMERTCRYMIERCGADITVEALGATLVERMALRVREEVAVQPGAKELLSELIEAGVPRALVSSSFRVLVDAVLDAVGHDLFVVTVAGDEVARAKPHPEPYLTAAARLGVDPARCVVLEDSPPGVAAAEAAGCLVVAVPSVAPLEPAPRRLVVRSLTELSLDRLRALIA